MARIVTGGLTTFNLGTHLDPQTLDLYGLRELISTPAFTSGVAFPAYGAGNAQLTINSSFQFGFGIVPEFKVTVSASAGVTAFHVGEGSTGAGIDFGVRFASWPSNTRALIGWAESSFPNAGSGGLLLAARGNTAASILFATQATTRAIIDPNGNLLVNRPTQAGGGRLEVGGNVVLQPAAGAPTLTTNGDMTFRLTSNTSLQIYVRGTDGVTRSATLTLA